MWNILTSSQGNSITNIQSINATQDNSINSLTTRVNTIEPKVTNMSFSNNNTSFSGGATFAGSTRFVGPSVFSNLPSIAYTLPVDFTLFTPFQDEQFVSKYYVDRIQKRTFGPSYIPSIRYGSKTTSSTGEITCDFLAPFPLQHNISPVNLITTLLYPNTTLLAGPVTVYITFLDSNRFKYQVKCLTNSVKY